MIDINAYGLVCNRTVGQISVINIEKFNLILTTKTEILIMHYDFYLLTY